MTNRGKLFSKLITLLLFFTPCFAIVFYFFAVITKIVGLELNNFTILVATSFSVLICLRLKTEFQGNKSIVLGIFIFLYFLLILPSLTFSGKRLGLANGNVDSGVHLGMIKSIIHHKQLLWGVEDPFLLPAEKVYPAISHMLVVAPSILLTNDHQIPVKRNIIIFNLFVLLNCFVFVNSLVLLLLLILRKNESLKVAIIIKVFVGISFLSYLFSSNFTAFWAQSVAVLLLSSALYLFDDEDDNFSKLLIGSVLSVGASLAWTLVLPITTALVTSQVLKRRHLLSYWWKPLIFLAILACQLIPIYQFKGAISIKHILEWGGVDRIPYPWWLLIFLFTFTISRIIHLKEKKDFLKPTVVLFFSTILTMVAILCFQLFLIGDVNYYFFKLFYFLVIPLIILSAEELNDLLTNRRKLFIINKILLWILIIVILSVILIKNTFWGDLYRGKLFYPDAHHYNTILALQEKYQDQKVRVLHIDQDFFGKYFRRALLLDTPHLLNLDESVTSKKSDQKTSLEKVGMWKSQLAPKGEKLVIFDAFSSIGQNCFLGLVQYAKRNNIDIYPDIDLQKMTQDCGSDQSLSQ